MGQTTLSLWITTVVSLFTGLLIATANAGAEQNLHIESIALYPQGSGAHLILKADAPKPSDSQVATPSSFNPGRMYGGQ